MQNNNNNNNNNYQNNNNNNNNNKINKNIYFTNNNNSANNNFYTNLNNNTNNQIKNNFIQYQFLNNNNNINNITNINNLINTINSIKQSYLSHFSKIPSEFLNSEHIQLKKKQLENPKLIKENIKKFEEYIILPLYYITNINSHSKETFYQEIYKKYLTIIHSILKKYNLESKTKVQAYGSLMNNFLIEDGDIDICIVPQSISIFEFSPYLDELEKELKNKICSIELNYNSNGRYHLLKTKENISKVNVDITVHTLLPIYNTELIRLYSLIDQRFHILGIYIKHFVKKYNMNGAGEKFLSSYALLIMIIHFLQNKKVLPILQKINEKKIEYVYVHNNENIISNIYFENDVNKIQEYMKNNNYECNENVGELLVEFFEFYCYEYDHSYLISINTNEKNKSSSEHIAFPIEDPFDKEHNPGKTMKLNTPQYDALLNCMKMKINEILSGDFLKYIKEDKINNINVNNNNNMNLNQNIQSSNNLTT